MIPARSILAAVATAALAGAAALAASGISACTVLVSDQPLDDAGPAAYATCNECQYQSCIGQWSVCGGSADCMAIYTCSTAPGCDQACVDQCYASHPHGQSPYYALATCDDVARRSATCSALCTAQPDAAAPDAAPDADTDAMVDAAPPPDAAAPDASPPDASVDAGTVLSCTDCTSQKCASQKAACATNTPCDLYTACLASCTDLACVTKCGTDHAAGQTASSDLGTCVQAQCAHECGL